MDPYTYHYLESRPDLLHFIRYNPVWYRYLSRNPQRIREMEKEAKFFHGKTLPQKLEKMNQQVQMAGMMLQFAEAMKD
ncbi:YlbE-like family protein [Virgibacillus xinjiangensis]|uniref:YlbE-like family protein n=1 Tax=Virgibacillus xinjiangensis TaxID=393090 RepID=A0ABV7CUR6_9BACI